MSKITEQELEQLKEQESKKSAILHDLGVLETQKHNLLHAYAVIQEEQNKSKIALEDKYGKINVDLSDGSYQAIEE
jgi:hypothetical protein